MRYSHSFRRRLVHDGFRLIPIIRRGGRTLVPYIWCREEILHVIRGHGGGSQEESQQTREDEDEKSGMHAVSAILSLMDGIGAGVWIYALRTERSSQGICRIGFAAFRWLG